MFFYLLQYFTGNRDQNTVVTNSFVPILRCRYIRVRPRGWYKHISMRVEFYGCFTGEHHLNSIHLKLEKY